MSTHLSSISNTFFVNLLNRLGVRPPPPDGFDLINVVQPVTLVDSDIVLPVSFGTQTLDLPFSAGLLLNPAAGTVLADSGVQPFGIYNMFFMVASNGSVSGVADLVLARRNAANAADIWAQSFNCGGVLYANPMVVETMRVQLQANERMVVRSGLQGTTAGLSVQSNIWLTV